MVTSHFFFSNEFAETFVQLHNHFGHLAAAAPKVKLFWLFRIFVARDNTTCIKRKRTHNSYFEKTNFDGE